MRYRRFDIVMVVKRFADNRVALKRAPVFGFTAPARLTLLITQVDRVRADAEGLDVHAVANLRFDEVSALEDIVPLAQGTLVEREGLAEEVVDPLE